MALTRRSIRRFHFSLPSTLRSIKSSPLFSTLCKNRQRFPPFSEVLTPPVPKKVPFSLSAHGLTLQDPFHWMANTKDPEFIDYLRQENSYAESFMSDTHELQRTLYSEMASRIPPEISTPPEKWGPWLYYQYIPEGKEYPVLGRKVALDEKSWRKTLFKFLGGPARDEILLDWNAIAELHGYVHVGICRMSPDHNFLAYTLDFTGSERFLLQIKDLRSGLLLPNLQVEGVVSLAWAQDGSTLFYTLSDQHQRPYRVDCINLESDLFEGNQLFVEHDPAFCVDISSTKDGKFITVNSNSRTSSEVFIVDANDLKAGLQRFCRRVSGVQYFLEHHHGFFYVLTNAPIKGKEIHANGSYSLARCQREVLDSSKLQHLVVPSEDNFLLDMDVFNENLVLFLNKDGGPSICSVPLPIDVNCQTFCILGKSSVQESNNMLGASSWIGTVGSFGYHRELQNQLELNELNPWFFPLPSNLCAVASGSNHDFMSSVYRVVLSSPVMPDMVVDYNMSNQSFSVVHQDDVANSQASRKVWSHHDGHAGVLSDIGDGKATDDRRKRAERWRDFSETLACERTEAISHDGVRIPLTIVYSKKAHLTGQSPGILHGYGAYGNVLERSWCTNRLSLLSRGWAVAFADVRGGAGADPSWHRFGSGLYKLNSIYDYIACAAHLIQEGYINKNQLAAVGVSAGCLLVAAAINIAPELFNAALLKVPFVDVCNTLSDPSLPLTLLDYEEFGDPRVKSHLENILKYSPYENISQGVCYPPMLVRAAYNDSRVGVWEGAKLVAKFRDISCPNCSSSIILTTDMAGGHFGEGGRFGECEEAAYEYSFLMRTLEACETRN